MVTPKIYLMTTTCSGKSYFAREHTSYCGLEIVDFTKVNRRITEQHDLEQVTVPGDSYGDRIIAYLLQRTDPVCVMGRRADPDPPRAAGIDYGAVLLPVEEHRRNWEARRQAKPSTRWQNFDDIESKREKLRIYAEEYCIPIFESFRGAIEALVACS